MKIKVSKEWCQRSAEIEGESSVGAGEIGPLMSGSERRPCSPSFEIMDAPTPTTETGWHAEYMKAADRAMKMECERNEAREVARAWRENWRNGASMSMIASSKLPWENVPAHVSGGGLTPPPVQTPESP